MNDARALDDPNLKEILDRRSPMHHMIRVTPDAFSRCWDGHPSLMAGGWFGFRAGDTIRLQEYSVTVYPDRDMTESYTGREIRAEISEVLQSSRPSFAGPSVNLALTGMRRHRVGGEMLPAVPATPVAVETVFPDPPRIGQVYRHFKGQMYSVVELPLRECDLAPLVVYRSAEDGRTWCRSLTDFLAVVGGVPRFTLAD
jgi:hypothetical protein